MLAGVNDKRRSGERPANHKYRIVSKPVFKFLPYVFFWFHFQGQWKRENNIGEEIKWFTRPPFPSVLSQILLFPVSTRRSSSRQEPMGSCSRPLLIFFHPLWTTQKRNLARRLTNEIRKDPTQNYTRQKKDKIYQFLANKNSLGCILTLKNWSLKILSKRWPRMLID